MQSPRLSQVEHLYNLSKTAESADLGREAERISKAPESTQLERGIAFVLWGYSLLRVNGHKYRDSAAGLISQGAVLLPGVRHQDPPTVDWATIILGMCWQMLGDHDKAVIVFDRVLGQPDVEIANRIKGAFSRAHSLSCLGRQTEALTTYQELAVQLDRRPDEEQTLAMRRERQRIRLNIADHYLNAGLVGAAENELNAIVEEYMTPLMNAALLSARARVAMLHDQWTEAEQLANRANDAALEANFIPLRLDALGVLVACAARKNRREEQHRLVNEMATLLQAK